MVSGYDIQLRSLKGAQLLFVGDFRYPEYAAREIRQMAAGDKQVGVGGGLQFQGAIFMTAASGTYMYAPVSHIVLSA